MSGFHLGSVNRAQEYTKADYDRDFPRECGGCALRAKVDELLSAIECAEQDIGHRPIADIIAELGQAYEASAK